MVRLIWGLIVSFFCIYYGILYENTIMITIGYAVLTLGGFCVLEVLYRRFTTKCRLSVPLSIVEHDVPVPVVFTITNRSIFSAGRLDLLIGVENAAGNRRDEQWISIPQVSAGTRSYEFEVTMEGAGRQKIALIKMRFQSTFGFFSMKKKSKERGEVLILPQMHSIMTEISEGTRNFLGDADVYDEFRPGHDQGESFEIREYREKDKLQSIHWKLSAKAEDLLVRERSLPKACPIVVLLDMQPLKKQIATEYLDAYLELATSVTFCLVDRKVPHFVAWFSKSTGDVRRIRVDDEESFYLLLNHYLTDGASQKEKNLRDAYREKYKNEIYRKDICINSHLEVYMDGTLIKKLDVENIKDECEKLELLL